MGLNRVMLIGRVEEAPKSRSISSAIDVAEFVLKIEKTYNGIDGKAKSHTLSINVQAYGPLAARCAGLTAGEDVTVEGRLRIAVSKLDEAWTNRYSVVAERVQEATWSPPAPRSGADMALDPIREQAALDGAEEGAVDSEAKEHLKSSVGEEAQWMGEALAVEPRYVANLAKRLQDNGFTVGE